MQNLSAVFFVLAILLWSLPTTAKQPLQYSAEEETERKKSWSDRWPIWGDRVREMGIELPKPFGLSVGRAGLDLPLDVMRTTATLSDTVIADLPKGKVRMDNLQGTNLSLRADMWVLPFLNLYGFMGETYGNINVSFDLPTDLVSQITSGLGADPFTQAFTDTFLQLGDNGISIERDFEFAGRTRGLGFTLAGGYKKFFMVADFNASKSKIDLLDDSVFSKVWSYRFGWNGHIKDRRARAWVGFMTHDVTQTAVVDLSGLNLPLLGDIKINLDVNDDKGKTPLAGFSVQLSDSWSFITDARFGERQMLNTMLEYRF